MKRTIIITDNREENYYEQLYWVENERAIPAVGEVVIDYDNHKCAIVRGAKNPTCEVYDTSKIGVCNPYACAGEKEYEGMALEEWAFRKVYCEDYWVCKLNEDGTPGEELQMYLPKEGVCEFAKAVPAINEQIKEKGIVIVSHLTMEE